MDLVTDSLLNHRTNASLLFRTNTRMQFTETSIIEMVDEIARTVTDLAIHEHSAYDDRLLQIPEIVELMNSAYIAIQELNETSDRMHITAMSYAIGG